MLRFPSCYYLKSNQHVCPYLPPPNADDPSAVVHGLLTADHLFDGTITTRTEQYYVEPAARYAPAAGVHSVVYRVSDVRHASDVAAPTSARRLPPTSAAHAKDDSYGDGDDAARATLAKDSAGSFCASERLRQKMQMDFKRRRKLTPTAKDGDTELEQLLAKRLRRQRRWLPEEVQYYLYRHGNRKLCGQTIRSRENRYRNFL